MKKLERILEAAAAGSSVLLGFCTILFLMLCMGPTSSIARPLAYAWLISFCCMSLFAALAVAVAKYNEICSQNRAEAMELVQKNHRIVDGHWGEQMKLLNATKQICLDYNLPALHEETLRLIALRQRITISEQSKNEEKQSSTSTSPADMFPHEYWLAANQFGKSEEQIKEMEMYQLYETVPPIPQTETIENAIRIKALYLIEFAEFHYAYSRYKQAAERIAEVEYWCKKLETPFVHAERLAQIKQKVNKQIK